MKREKVAIIGNGMAAGKLLDDIIRRDGLSRMEITVFGEEPHGCYNRILLNQVLMGDPVDAITMKDRDWYSSRGVGLHTDSRVARVSSGVRRLWTESGSEHYFDKAVFATGSAPRIPRTEGLRQPDGTWKEGLHAYRTIADADRIRMRCTRDGNAFIVGGGLLGLEAAKALRDLGMRVTVIHLYGTLLNRQVDIEGAAILKKSVEAAGIRVRTGCSIKAVIGARKVEAIDLGDGEVVRADMVVFASGVTPRVDVARDSDVPVNSGILVDDQMRTGLPGIFAVGDCVEHSGKVYGTIQPVYEQCAVLADVLTGANPAAAYKGSRVNTRLKVAGIEVASMGEIEPRDVDDEVVQTIEAKRRIYRKLVVREGRLVGAVLVGDASGAPALARRFERGDPLPHNRLDLFATPESQANDGDPVLCGCHQVTESAVKEAVRSGCQTLKALGERTGAGTGCGSCKGRLATCLPQQGGRPPCPLPVPSPKDLSRVVA